MFAVQCETCARQSLVSFRSILGMENADGCIKVTYRCSCDSVETWVTGARR